MQPESIVSSYHKIFESYLDFWSYLDAGPVFDWRSQGTSHVRLHEASWAELSHEHTTKVQLQNFKCNYCPTKCPTFFAASMQQKTCTGSWTSFRPSASKGNFFITWYIWSSSSGGIHKMRLNSFVSQWPHTYTVCIQGLHAGVIQLLSWLVRGLVRIKEQTP